MLRLGLIAALTAAPVSAQTLGPSVSGDARMGIVWQPQPDWAGQRENGLRMTSRARLQFQFTGETDGGLRFGANIRVDKSGQNRKKGHVFIGEGS